MDMFSPQFWEEGRVDPAASTIITSGRRFPTADEAERYGKEHFREAYTGYTQVEYKEDTKPF